MLTIQVKIDISMSITGGKVRWIPARVIATAI
jgi:hypothetical protein